MTIPVNQIYTHPGQPEMQAEVILASKSKYALPIFTIRLRYPRIIHSEIMTHRVFSRNARSSRAVPVQTMLDEVRTKPFVPWHWGKNQKGMQAAEECNEPVLLDFVGNYWETDIPYSREASWLYARDYAVEVAEAFMTAGYHKQIPNRLLEPFMWIDTLITATDWDNFLWLRDHKDAEPHLQDLARLVKQAMDSAKIRMLGEYGGWHLPYIRDEDFDWAYKFISDRDDVLVPDRQERARLLAKISAARCARISYKPFDGNASYEAELARYDSLINSDRVHASPVEHQAQADRHDPDYPNTGIWEGGDLRGNFAPGWIQYRKTIPNECHKG